jgi:hypothetical protein
MALFSRRAEAASSAAGEAPAGESGPTPIPTPIPGPDVQTAVPRVGISLSTFDGLGLSPATPAFDPAGEADHSDAVTLPSAPPTPRRIGPLDGAAPPTTEAVPGIPDNVLARDAIAALGGEPAPHEVLGAVRQLLQGPLYVRVKGDAHALTAAGVALPLAVATREDGDFLLVFTGGAALAAAIEADGDAQTSALGRPARAVLENATHGDFAGIIVDHASAPTSTMLPRSVLERTLADAPADSPVKALLCGPRTIATPGEIVTALADAPLWVAANRQSEDDEWGVAESRTPDGERVLEVFSHPLEVIALGRGDQAVPLPKGGLARALADDPEIAGIVLDPGGPWILLRRPQLATLITSADRS